MSPKKWNSFILLVFKNFVCGKIHHNDAKKTFSYLYITLIPRKIYIFLEKHPPPPKKTKVSVATAYQYWGRAVGWSSCLQGPLLQWWRLLRRAWWQEWPPSWLCWYQNWNTCTCIYTKNLPKFSKYWTWWFRCR